MNTEPGDSRDSFTQPLHSLSGFDEENSQESFCSNASSSLPSFPPLSHSASTPLPTTLNTQGGPDTTLQSEASQSTPTPQGELMKKPQPIKFLKSAKLLAQSQGADFGTVPAENIVEYEWPPHSGEKFFLQEQITEFLNIKSFKRKYPELQRRAVEPHEKDFLKEWGAVTETQADLGLTAIHSAEVHDLISGDYPEQYADYQRVLSERMKQEIEAKHKEYQSIKADSQKLAELRKKAVNAVADWNAELNRERLVERRGFWDVQTMRVQYPQRKKVRYETNLGTYPVALITGQYQNEYRTYSGKELNKLPLNTVLDTSNVTSPKPPPSPPSIVVPEAEIKAATEKEERERNATADKNPDVAPEQSRGGQIGEHCAFCEQDLHEGDKFIQCAQCASCAHPTCLELSEEIFQVVKTYEWMCMECKPCSVCSNIDEEDKMMFCDRCDRGYHTFCVGLEDLPTGRWVCEKFCGGLKEGEATDSKPKGKRKVASDGKDDNETCKECGTGIGRTNKVHHRSKHRNAGLCSTCVHTTS